MKFTDTLGVISNSQNSMTVCIKQARHVPHFQAVIHIKSGKTHFSYQAQTQFQTVKVTSELIETATKDIFDALHQ